MLRNINTAYEKVVGMLIALDMRWEFDDTNFTDFPRGVADLVASQHDYSFDTTHLAVEEVHIMDSSGDYYKLKPINRNDFSEPLDEYFDTAGKPEYYDKDGKSVLIYPAPAAGDVTTTSGLRVFFRRTADKFSSILQDDGGAEGTGTKLPGFASPFHMIIAYEAAIAFNLVYKPTRVAAIKALSDKMLEDMIGFYTKREKDEKSVITMGGINFR